MKSLITIGLLCLPLLLLAQKNYQLILLNQELDDTLYHQKIMLISEIESDEASEKYEMRSNCIVNADSKRILDEVDSFWKGDTLLVEIHGLNPAYSQKLVLKIIKGQVSSTFNYMTSGPMVNRKIKTVSQKLVLNTLELKKDSRLKGYIQYSGLCIKNCDDPILLTGYFYTDI